MWPEKKIKLFKVGEALGTSVGKGFRNGLVQSPFCKRRTGDRELRRAAQGPAAHLRLQPLELLLTMSFKTSQVWLVFLLPLPLCPPLWVLFLRLKKNGVLCSICLLSLSYHHPVPQQIKPPPLSTCAFRYAYSSACNALLSLGSLTNFFSALKPSYRCAWLSLAD